jgi:POT family proton-dependent oligopeptide transporter
VSVTVEAPATPVAKGRLPKQIAYIIGNEGCERFSFYGMRNILTVFLVSSLLLSVPEEHRAGEAKDVFHIFVMGVYFFPLLGGWLSDRYWGKYKTIFWLSLVYCAGHAFLALFETNRTGFYAGLFLIALGSGGIKPCVSAFVGEQFDASNKHLARIVYDAFYWIINFGSFFASLLIPLTLERYGPKWAFGIPGILMFIATFVFWLGRKRYVVEPPKPQDPDAFARVVKTALTAESPGQGRPGLTVFRIGAIVAVGCIALSWVIGPVAAICLALVVFLVATGIGSSMQIERARGKHSDEAVSGVRSVWSVLVLFFLVTPFHSLFDQKASTWVLQAGAMEMPGWKWFANPSQMQALNPLLVMLFIPLNNVLLFPAMRKMGMNVTPLGRMTAGIAFAGVSWILAGLLQLRVDSGAPTSILWQSLPYAFLTFGEVLVSATGLEFAYSQAPPQLKGVLMSFWTLTVTVGSLWVLLANAAVKNDAVTESIASTGFGVMAFQMFFFAGFAFLAAVAFGICARRYKTVDHYRGG